MSALNKIKDSTRKVERAIVGAAFESIWSLAVSKAPFLMWPVVKQIGRFFLEHTLYWLSEAGIIWFNLVWIRINISADFEALENERQLAILAIDGGATDEELEEIDRALVDAFRRAHRIGRAPL